MMGAKDTVMDDSQVLNFYYVNRKKDISEKGLLGAQAEISFKAGEGKGRREVVELALQAIKDEPEFPSDMPDELWEKIGGDREITQRVMQNTVRITKQCIKERLVAKLKNGGYDDSR